MKHYASLSVLTLSSIKYNNTVKKMERQTLKKKAICDILRNTKLTLSEQIESCTNIIERAHGKTIKEAKKAALKNKLQKLKSETKKRYIRSHKNWSNTLRDNKVFFEWEFELADIYFED